MSKQPNILILIPHDLGDNLHCYGHRSVESPHLDRLASEGVRFANVFTPSPECTPSRGCLYSGYYPHQNGLMGLSNFGWSLNEETPHIARRLRDHGYSTHLFGLQHEAHGAADQIGAKLGYEHLHGGSASATEVCTRLIEWLETEGHESGEPWFACAGFHHTHRPWPENRHFAPATVDVPPFLPDTPLVRDDLARFHQSIRDMDEAVGRVLATVRELKMGDDTLVVFTSDHGAGFPRAKATLYDPGIKVPLLMWGAGLVGGRVLEPLVGNLDLAPTLMELAGVPVPTDLPGRSLRPLLDGETDEHRDAVYGALFYDVAYDPMHYVRTRNYKYIRSFAVTDDDAAGADPDVLTSFAGGELVRVDDFDVLSSPTWQQMRLPWPKDKPPAEELYCLRNDPDEFYNLVDDPDHGQALERLRGMLGDMMEATSSPLLQGHVAPPPEQRAAAARYAYGGDLYRERGIVC